MSTELLAMLGGGASGFLFKLIGTMVNAQQANVDNLIKKQKASDSSANAAAKRTGNGGNIVRRTIVITVLFGVIIAPFILAHSNEGVTVANEYSKWFGLIKGTSYETLHGYVILPEIRQTVLAIVGYYFGSSSVK
jgi:hypothetical protein